MRVGAALPFLTSVLNGSEHSVTRYSHFTLLPPGRVFMDDMETRKVLNSGDSNTDRPSVARRYSKYLI